jgi:hypothetical protein
MLEENRFKIRDIWNCWYNLCTKDYGQRRFSKKGRTEAIEDLVYDLTNIVVPVDICISLTNKVVSLLIRPKTLKEEGFFGDSANEIRKQYMDILMSTYRKKGFNRRSHYEA